MAWWIWVVIGVAVVAVIVTVTLVAVHVKKKKYEQRLNEIIARIRRERAEKQAQKQAEDLAKAEQSNAEQPVKAEPVEEVKAEPATDSTEDLRVEAQRILAEERAKEMEARRIKGAETRKRNKEKKAAEKAEVERRIAVAEAAAAQAKADKEEAERKAELAQEAKAQAEKESALSKAEADRAKADKVAAEKKAKEDKAQAEKNAKAKVDKAMADKQKAEKKAQEAKLKATKAQAEKTAAEKAKVAAEKKAKEEKAQSKEPAVKGAGKWVIEKKSGDEFMSKLVANNGEVMLSSEIYTTSDGARNGIETIVKNINGNGEFIIYQDKKKNYYYKLKTSTNRLLCVGEIYTTKSACQKAVESVKRMAQDSVIATDIIEGEYVEYEPIKKPNYAGSLAGKWIIEQGEDKSYSAKLYASNGQLMLATEGVASKATALTNIDMVKTNSADGNFIIDKDKFGKFYFKLRNSQKSVICIGESYETLDNCTNALESVRRNAAISELVEETETTESKPSTAKKPAAKK